MNKRILELAEQAGFENGHQDYDGRSLSNELEKFAELIIEECAQRAEVYAYMSPNFNALAEELREMVSAEKAK